MGLQVIDIDERFDIPLEKLFAYLGEHENLGPLFGAKIARLRDGEDARNGVGSVRAVKVGPMPPFDETVTAYEPDALIEYRITRGGVLKNHLGRMVFTRDGEGSRLHYTIEFEGRIPFIAWFVRIGLERTLRRAFAGLSL